MVQIRKCQTSASPNIRQIYVRVSRHWINADLSRVLGLRLTTGKENPPSTFKSQTDWLTPHQALSSHHMPTHVDKLQAIHHSQKEAIRRLHAALLWKLCSAAGTGEGTVRLLGNRTTAERDDVGNLCSLNPLVHRGLVPSLGVGPRARSSCVDVKSNAITSLNSASDWTDQWAGAQSLY